jgi:hypothetical protein
VPLVQHGAVAILDDDALGGVDPPPARTREVREDDALSMHVKRQAGVGENFSLPSVGQGQTAHGGVRADRRGLPPPVHSAMRLENQVEQIAHGACSLSWREAGTQLRGKRSPLASYM